MSGRIWWGWKYAIGLICVIAFLCLFVLPFATTLLISNADSLPSGSTKPLLRIEKILTYSMLFFAATWIVFVGGTFASFLNVVAWRVPRGKSILGSSRCPTCNTKLSIRDNIPFWGWLKNWGHCSICDGRFSSRYLFTEIVLGAIFLLVAGAYFVTGGAPLPFRDKDAWTTVHRMLLEPKSDLVLITSHHLTALLALFTFALIEYGRHKIPPPVYFVGLVAVLAFSVWPNVLLVAWQFPFANVPPSGIFARIIAIALGLAIGFSVGKFLNRIAKQRFHSLSKKQIEYKNDQHQLQFGFSIIGCALSWQSAIFVAVIWALLAMLIPRKQVDSERTGIATPHALAVILTLVHLATWKWLELLILR